MRHSLARRALEIGYPPADCDPFSALPAGCEPVSRRRWRPWSKRV